MASLKIGDYVVDFPYMEPYDIQKSYMEKVIECLHNKVHGVLESPTGTGKTLCLLAPVSAWVKKQKAINKSTRSEECYDYGFESSLSVSSSESQESAKWGVKTKNVVWYTSRTHSQIAQTIAEIRRCNIKGLNIRVMGARDQLCINSEVLNEQDSYIKTIKCKELIKAKMCKYYLRLNQEKNPAKYFQEGEVLDIEDLVSVGKSCGVCPYFLSKSSIDTADIVLLPYNYIIDKDSRDANGFQFKGDVVIFDEGHNVPVTCEESYEFEFSSVDIALGIKNLKDLMANLNRLSEYVDEEDEAQVAKHAENAIFMLEILQKLESGLDCLEIEENLLPVSTLLQFFEKAGIQQRTSNQLLRSIEDFKSESERLSLNGSMLTTFYLFEKMMSTIFGSTVRSFDTETIDRSFKCGVRFDQDKNRNVKKVNLYCFNPSFGIRAILQLGVQSIIITSGTLSPLRTFIYELNLPKPVTLINGHIAKKSQVPFLIVGTGVNNIRMDAAFTNRTDPKYIFSLGMTLTNLIASVPDGVLLLFSSYTMMQNLKEAWESDLGIWKRLNSLKRVFLEPRGKEEFINCMENYKRAIDSGNGAVLMGVLRGKISEGMDFKDQYCRAVFVVGVPFPPTRDPRVKGKEKYAESLMIVDQVTKTSQRLYNNSFMSVEAMKATNQAIGRVIRHGQDYGAIVLVDHRFSRNTLFQNLSGWLRDTPTEKNFSQAKKLGVPEIRRQRVDGNGCPVAEQVSYEEYDHKKSIRTQAPRINVHGLNVEETKQSGGSVIKYIDDNFDGITMLYDSSQSQKSPRTVETRKSNSIFHAFESAKSILPSYEEKKCEDDQKDVETFKRKLQNDVEDRQSCKMSCLDQCSTSGIGLQVQKKVSRFKIKPFSKNDELEPECIKETQNFVACHIDHSKIHLSEPELKDKGETEGEALKMKLINYFRLAKRILSEEQERDFKKCSFRYMKGESGLSEVISQLDRIFRDCNEKDKLYSDLLTFKFLELKSRVKELEQSVLLKMSTAEVGETFRRYGRCGKSTYRSNSFTRDFNSKNLNGRDLDHAIGSLKLHKKQKNRDIKGGSDSELSK